MFACRSSGPDRSLISLTARPRAFILLLMDFLVCFEFSGDYSPVQEDAQIHLWEASAGVQAGVFRQTSK